MNEWLKMLVGYMLIVSIATQMLPDKKYEQYVRLFTGLLLLICILQPILKIGAADSFLESKISAFLQEQEQIEQQIGVQTEEFRMETENMQSEGVEEIEIAPVGAVEVNLDD